MGKDAAFVFTLRLLSGRNAAVLEVSRALSDGDDVHDQVRLVFRPDVEWRSFHTTTQAYAGHPLYRGVYAGDEDTARKPAYHNGTVWAWPFPL